MAVLLAWLGRFLLGAFVGEAFKKAAVFVGMSTFFYIFVEYGLPMMGEFAPTAMKQIIQTGYEQITNPDVMFWLVYFQVPFGLTIVINAALTRLVLNIFLRAMSR